MKGKRKENTPHFSPVIISRKTFFLLLDLIRYNKNMNESDETLEMTDRDAILKAIADLSRKFDDLSQKIDDHKKESDVQFEAIRAGIAASNIAFERLAGKVYLISANLAEMQEEMRQRSRESLV